MSAKALACAVLALALCACQREERRFQEPPVTGIAPQSAEHSTLRAGGGAPDLRTKYPENAYAISQGKQLFTWFNCNGCHARGGGGMGPALIDDKWLYGAEPEDIYATIVQGRPNGMPSFRGRITDQQVWQLVAYVRSMSGLAPGAAAPGRGDEMQAAPPEQTRDPQQPRSGGHVPPAR